MTSSTGDLGRLIRLTTNDHPKLDDAGLSQRIKSEVLGPAQLSDVEVDVENGIVLLTGNVDDAQYRRLAKQISKVPGVESMDRSMARARAERRLGNLNLVATEGSGSEIAENDQSSAGTIGNEPPRSESAGSA